MNIASDVKLPLPKTTRKRSGTVKWWERLAANRVLGLWPHRRERDIRSKKTFENGVASAVGIPRNMLLNKSNMQILGTEMSL